jgi:SEC-C motif
MPNKAGRNDPCPCGSGKKYKRCCLPTDETAARERARQQGPFDADVFGDHEFDGDVDGEEFFDIEDTASVLDTRTITHVSYMRGFVSRLTDLRSGRGIRVTEWEAPRIPESVLDSIDREGLDALEGEWGDPKIGDPIQVDVINIETATDIISVEVFNRAICLVHADSEEMRRIHRVCGALEGATPGASGQSAEEGDAPATGAAVRSTEMSQPTVEFDVSAVLKEHRRQGGSCALCGVAVTRATAQKHLAACAPAHDAVAGPEQRLIQFRVTAPGLPPYWLDIEVKAEARLDALDSFLRQIWLECCGHLSAFRVGPVKYFSRGYDFGFSRAFGSLGRRRLSERSMTVKVRDALMSSDDALEYEYDFGSTTNLRLRVTGERTGRSGRPAVRLLVRNTPPEWPCAVCGQPASKVCAYCIQEEGNAFICTKHEKQHACGEVEGFLPVVDSPRMGVCGYTGGS